MRKTGLLRMVAKSTGGLAQAVVMGRSTPEKASRTTLAVMSPATATCSRTKNPSGYAPEAHDFTAGAANYNQYDANAGYVDLQRSNSGGHAAGADLARGPSVGHNGYDAQYGAYGAHEAYAQDPYGGYDAYGGQHQQEQYPQAQYAAGYQQGARY